MTVGIYCISFSGTDRVYIGQSVNIEKRWINHLSTMKSGKHFNFKLIEAYSLFGEPKLEILEKCGELDLNAKEIQWIDEFNSLNNGFNLCKGGRNQLSGCNSPSSVYSEAQIIACLRLLSTETEIFTSFDIQRLTGVCASTVRHISCGKIHVWLKEFDNVAYDKMRALQKLGRNGHDLGTLLSAKDLPIPIVVAPDGSEHPITNVRSFCEEFHLDRRHFSKVLQGKAKTHLGFRLK